MAIKKNIFITANGLTLPGWQLAFANATTVRPGQVPDLGQGDCVWLRLQPGEPAEQQIQQVGTHLGKAALIILSDTPNDQEAMAVFAQSARGYANSHAGAATLKQIAKVVDQGGLWVGESLMQRLMLGMQHLPSPAASKPTTPKLTAREMEVAQAIAAGASNKEVARQLNITERTVKAHVSGLFTKLAVQDRLQLALKMRELF